MEGYLAVRMGHMEHVDQGATGIVKEFDIIRAYAPYAIAYIKRTGLNVLDVTPREAFDMEDSLDQGVDMANNASATEFISCHANSFFDILAHGCQVMYYPGSMQGQALAEKIKAEVVKLGFTDRGARADDRGLFELKHTDMTAVIIEPFFITNADDVAIYNKVGPQALGEAIAKGYLNYKGITLPTDQPVKKVQAPVVTGKIARLQELCNSLGATDESGNKLEVDGIAGPCTRAAVSKLPVVRVGLQNDNGLVRFIQATVGAEIDGDFGPLTRAAVVAWQIRHNLLGDGIVGPITWNSFI